MATGAYSDENPQQQSVEATQPSISTDSSEQDLVRQEAMLKSVDSKGKLKDSSMGIPTEVMEPDMSGFETVEGEKEGREREDEVLQEAEEQPKRGLLGSALAAVAETATGIKEALTTATQEMLGVAGMAGMAPNHEEDEEEEEEREERITDATTDEDHDIDIGSNGNDKAAVQEAQEVTEEAFGGGAEGRWLSMHAPPTSAVADNDQAAAPGRAEREEEEEEGGDNIASFDDVPPSSDDVTAGDTAVDTSRVTPEQQKAADEILRAFRVHTEDPSTAAREEQREEEAEDAYGGDKTGVFGPLDEADEAQASSTPKSRTNRLSAKEINGQGIMPSQSQGRNGILANGDEEDVVVTTNQDVGGAEGGVGVEQRSREVTEKLREEKGGDKTDSPVADEDVEEADTTIKKKPVDPVAESLAHLQGLDLVNEGHGSLGAAAVLEHLRAMRESEAAAASAGNNTTSSTTA